MENINGNGNDDGRTDVIKLANALENKSTEEQLIGLAADLLTHKYPVYVKEFSVDTDMIKISIAIPREAAQLEIKRRQNGNKN